MKSLTVPGTLDSLPAIGQYVLAATEAAGLDKKSAYGMRLAVDEIATNVITHGYEAAGLTGSIDLSVTEDDTSLTIRLEDCGATYRPDEVSRQAPVDGPLEQRPLGGLGVYLAMRNVDRLLYERRGDKNRHTFIVFKHRGE